MKPRIIFLIDKKGWVFDSIAQEIVKRLKDKYKFSLYYVTEKCPDFRNLNFDLLYVFFWAREYLCQCFSIGFDQAGD